MDCCIGFSIWIETRLPKRRFGSDFRPTPRLSEIGTVKVETTLVSRASARMDYGIGSSTWIKTRQVKLNAHSDSPIRIDPSRVIGMTMVVIRSGLPDQVLMGYYIGSWMRMGIPLPMKSG